MKIVTWNINSVRLRVNIIKKLQEEENPDVLLLQESKTENQFFPVDALRDIGYKYLIFSGEKSYNGVAILSKFPISNEYCLSFHNHDKRHIACVINDVEIHNFYIPAGGDIPDIELNPKFFHKLEYLKLLENWFLVNRKKSDKIILAGDLNIAPYEHDVWSSKALKYVVSHTDAERQLMLRIVSSFEWQDVARHFSGVNEKLYSWWSYRNKDWMKSNRGRRLDHIWVSKEMLPSCKSFKILKDARNWEKPSDHVPVILTCKL